MTETLAQPTPRVNQPICAPRNGGWDSSPIVGRYLATNPKQINPFNCNHHNFVPSGDAQADADYLALVASGEADRFYITLVELTTAAGRYNVVCYDGFNGNVLLSQLAIPAERSGEPAAHTADDRLLLALDAAIAVAVEQGLAFRPDLAVVHSRLGREHLALLVAYAGGNEVLNG